MTMWSLTHSETKSRASASRENARSASRVTPGATVVGTWTPICMRHLIGAKVVPAGTSSRSGRLRLQALQPRPCAVAQRGHDVRRRRLRRAGVERRLRVVLDAELD